MKGRNGDRGSTNIAFTRESFCRYASSTCQRTSSDREPTLRSSKFWGGRLLASRRCSASYRFVCCGLLRAWCSLGLPILVSRAAGCWLFTVALRAASRCAKESVGACLRARGCPSPDRHSRQDARYSGRAAVFGAGCGRRLHAQTAPATSIGAIRTPPWGDCHAVRVRDVSNSHKPVLARRMRQGQHRRKRMLP